MIAALLVRSTSIHFKDFFKFHVMLGTQHSSTLLESVRHSDLFLSSGRLHWSVGQGRAGQGRAVEEGGGGIEVH